MYIKQKIIKNNQKKNIFSFGQFFSFIFKLYIRNPTKSTQNEQKNWIKAQNQSKFGPKTKINTKITQSKNKCKALNELTVNLMMSLNMLVLEDCTFNLLFDISASIVLITSHLTSRSPLKNKTHFNFCMYHPKKIVFLDVYIIFTHKDVSKT